MLYNYFIISRLFPYPCVLPLGPWKLVRRSFTFACMSCHIFSTRGSNSRHTGASIQDWKVLSRFKNLFCLRAVCFFLQASLQTESALVRDATAQVLFTIFTLATFLHSSGTRKKPSFFLLVQVRMQTYLVHERSSLGPAPLVESESEVQMPAHTYMHVHACG